MFRKYSNPILSAVSGELDYSDFSKRFHLSSALPSYPDEENKNTDDIVECLTMTKSLLCAKTFDAQHMGIHSLNHLTDITRTKPATSLASSHAVLSNSNEDYSQGIQLTIFEILNNWELRDKVIFAGSSTINVQERHDAYMLNEALSVLSNSLDVLIRSGEQVNFREIHENLENKGVIERLWDILSYSHIRPHDAQLAAKSIYLLMTAYPEAQKNALAIERKTIIDNANSFASLSHAALARECQGLLAIL